MAHMLFMFCITMSQVRNILIVLMDNFPPTFPFVSTSLLLACAAFFTGIHMNNTGRALGGGGSGSGLNGQARNCRSSKQDRYIRSG